MNKHKDTRSTSYVVCPKSGLSYKIIADWNATSLSEAIHPDAAKGYLAMGRTIRNHLHDIPNSYLAAFCQVWARDNDLLIESHKAYQSGRVTETLAKLHRKALINLFWICYNSTAGSSRIPIKINLDDVHTPNALQDMFILVATQTTNDIRIEASKSEYKPRLKGKAPTRQIKMDIKACIGRMTKLLPKLTNANPSEEITVESAKKAVLLLRSYTSIKPKARERIIEIIDYQFQWANAEDMYTKTSLEWKTYEIVRHYLTENLQPVELLEVEF